jgi:hypothetical protein
VAVRDSLASPSTWNLFAPFVTLAVSLISVIPRLNLPPKYSEIVQFVQFARMIREVASNRTSRRARRRHGAAAQVTAAVGTGGVLISKLPAPPGSTKDELP